jgi:hypothetical protein
MWLTLFCLSVITTKPMRGHDNNNMKTSKIFDVTERPGFITRSPR